MTYKVLVRNHPANGYIAIVLAFPGYSVEAATRQEALDRMYTTILKLLAESELVEMEVPTPMPVIASSYAETFGMFRADPTFAEAQQEIESYHRVRNQIRTS